MHIMISYYDRINICAMAPGQWLCPQHALASFQLTRDDQVLTSALSWRVWWSCVHVM